MVALLIIGMILIAIAIIIGTITLSESDDGRVSGFAVLGVGVFMFIGMFLIVLYAKDVPKNSLYYNIRYDVKTELLNGDTVSVDTIYYFKRIKSK